MQTPPRGPAAGAGAAPGAPARPIVRPPPIEIPPMRPLNFGNAAGVGANQFLANGTRRPPGGSPGGVMRRRGRRMNRKSRRVQSRRNHKATRRSRK